MIKKLTGILMSLVLFTGISFAAMPDETVVLTDLNKAVSLDNIDIIELQDEINDSNKDDLYVKASGLWFNVSTTKIVDKELIPSVNYYDNNGNVIVYEEHDGDEITDSFYIKNID